jgi:RES domain-containing protein
MVYTSEHLSLAMIEYLVHLDPNYPPRDLMVVRAEVPDNLPRLQLRIDELPSGWQDYPAPQSLAITGDRFVREMKAAVLIIPSAAVPTENNWLMNPNHPDFRQITPGSAEPFRYEPRLIRQGEQ